MKLEQINDQYISTSALQTHNKLVKPEDSSIVSMNFKNTVQSVSNPLQETHRRMFVNLNVPEVMDELSLLFLKFSISDSLIFKQL